MLYCDICIKSKHQRKIQRLATPQATRPLELLDSDPCGPISPESASEVRYFILYLDHFSRLTWVYFLQCKSASEVVSSF